jgi:hypothetical protein
MEVEGCFLRLFTEILFGPLFRYRMRTKTFKNSIEDRFVSQTLKLHRSNHRSSISIKSSKLHLDQIIEAPSRSNHRSSTDQIFSPPPNDDPPTRSETESAFATSPSYTSRLSPRSCKGSPDRPSPTTASTALVAGCTAHTNTTCTRTRSLTPNFGGFLVGIRG